jgi:hypothetical protein
VSLRFVPDSVEVEPYRRLTPAALIVNMDTRSKIIPASSLPEPPYTLVIARVAALTAEHCRALTAAKTPGRPLVVALAADSYGGPYPLDEGSRAQLVAALAVVDHVVICDQPETERLVAAAGSAVDLEAQVGRDVIADVLERHPPA